METAARLTVETATAGPHGFASETTGLARRHRTSALAALVQAASQCLVGVLASELPGGLSTSCTPTSTVAQPEPDPGPAHHAW
jgi:hypothetical protein